MRIGLPLLPFSLTVGVERRSLRRPSIRSLMLAVAVVAVLLGGYLYLLNREPWVRYARAATRFHAEWEQRGRANAQWAEKRGFLDEVDLNRRSADQHKALKLKWLAAPWRPWAKIPPDPYASDIQGDPEG